MVVATTRSAGQHAARFQVARRHQQNGVAVDHVALRAGQHAAVGVAVESDAQIRAARLHFAGHVLRMQRAAVGVDVAAVGRDVEQGDVVAPVAIQTPEELRRNGRGRAVGAIGHDLQVRERKAGNAVDQKLDVVGLQRRIVLDGWKALRVGDLHLRGVVEDFVFHGQFHRIGQFEAVRAKELDAVVLPGIVRSRDHHACVETVRAREKRDRRRGHNARAFDLCACLAQALCQRGRDPRSGLARVAAEKHPGFCCGFSQRVRQRQSHAVNCRGVERGLARDGANAVGAEKFTCGRCGHDVDFLPRLPELGDEGAFFGAVWGAAAAVDSTRLENEPSARRVVTRSPAAICAVERTRAPSAESTRA